MTSTSVDPGSHTDQMDRPGSNPMVTPDLGWGTSVLCRPPTSSSLVKLLATPDLVLIEVEVTIQKSVLTLAAVARGRL